MFKSNIKKQNIEYKSSLDYMFMICEANYHGF